MSGTFQAMVHVAAPRATVMFQFQDAGPSSTLPALSQDGIPPWKN